MSALQQELHAADGDRLVDLPEDFVEAEHVAIGVPDRPVERAEVAARDADVRVVDVAVDDVGDHAFRVFAGADVIGGAGEPVGRGVAVEEQRLVWRQASLVVEALLQGV